MSSNIEIEKLVIKEVFSRWYKVPEYQRPYLWKTDKIEELLFDINASMSNDSSSTYFLGALVLKKKPVINGDAYDEYELLDGQQRLITLLLIFAVMRDKCRGVNIKDFAETCGELIFQKENEYKNIPERTRVLFSIREKVENFIEKHINSEGQTSPDIINSIDKSEVSIKNMCDAINTIYNFINDNGFECSQISKLLKYILNNVLIINVISNDLKDAYLLFQVLNARGLKLRNSDILKAENLSHVSDDEKRNEYAKKWEAIENALDGYFNDDESYFDNLLSHIRTILVKEKATNSLLEEFNQKIYRANTVKYLLTRGEETFRCVRDYYNLFDKLFDGDYKANDSYEVNNLIVMMKGLLPSDYWIAAFLSYCKKNGEDNIHDFLVRLDNKVSYDWIVKETLTTRIKNINRILRELEATKSIDNLLKNDCFKINSNELREAISSDVYGKRYTKYLLYKLNFLYQDNLTKWSIHPKISIEHILPQNPNGNSDWVIRDFKTPQQREEWTNKIGNLILIARRKNSKLSNKDYGEKKDRYFNGNIESLAHSSRLMTHQTWKPADLGNNHNEVIGKLMDRYSQNPH